MTPETWTLWWAALVLAGAVSWVVYTILRAIRNTVQQIYDEVARIWGVGQSIANNTIHIALLERTDRLLDEVRTEVETIHRLAKEMSSGGPG